MDQTLLCLAPQRETHGRIRVCVAVGGSVRVRAGTVQGTWADTSQRNDTKLALCVNLPEPWCPGTWSNITPEAWPVLSEVTSI